ncbi:hypothetical protein ONZ45_g16737 [Pleurotus djamor]|nr:hypothetical protein ONZ45_g16737 [Pleurotus djamor]
MQMTIITLHPTLSRTVSATSISSDDTTTSNGTTVRRTRRRFNSEQLSMLEQLYHQNSHPTRAERDAVAKAGGMENRSVTIWFQNKRQTERRVAMNNAVNETSTSSVKARSIKARRASSPFTSSSSSRSSRPSLDRVASRSELWAPPPPRTPTRPINQRYRYHVDEDDSLDGEQPSSKNLWDNMPSSPAAPPFSPPARDYVEFGRTQQKRTLEWACAAARLAEKDGLKLKRHKDEEEDDDTDIEVHEAITPPGTLGAADRKWDSFISGSGRSLKSLNIASMKASTKQEEDHDEVMKAALALCGLGQRC